jgi:hypothetical protein
VSVICSGRRACILVRLEDLPSHILLDSRVDILSKFDAVVYRQDKRISIATY